MKRILIGTFLFWGVLTIACNKSDDTGGSEDDSDSQIAGHFDADDSIETATELSLNTDADGYIYPTEDQDWYSFTIGPGTDLLTVNLSIDAPVTPVNPTYSIWSASQEEVASPLSSEAAAPQIPLAVTHGLPAGNYHIVIRDRGNDGHDNFHTYALKLTAGKDPDTNEPNNDETIATPISDTVMQGHISYRGDTDWYAVETAGNQVLDIALTMPMSGIEPTLTVFDPNSENVLSLTNPSGSVSATELSYSLALETAGTYHVVVHDDDDLQNDMAVAYSLSTSLRADPDPNEANDHPSSATPLAALTCQAQWSEWTTAEGYIASLGDVDWYKFDIAECNRGVLEVEVAFTSATALPPNMQASARVVRTVLDNSCETDQNCQRLQQVCERNIDCAGIGNDCLTEGICAGSGFCLPDGNCGGTLYSETATAEQPKTIRLSTPLKGWTELYLAVSDHASDAFSLDHPYTVRYRAIIDKDTSETNEAYAAGPPGAEPHEDAPVHESFAKEVAVHDCTGSSDAGVDCCNDDTWQEGYLSYKHDQDWYKYQHPCPGNDCMVNVVYDFGSGPVDFYMQVYSNHHSWFDNLSDTVDLAEQNAKTGHFGGIEGDDYCFYAYQGHGSIDEIHWYYLPIRDTIYVSEGNEESGTWDWSVEQPYRFCVEKISNSCVAPCELYEDGCGAPSE